MAFQEYLDNLTFAGFTWLLLGLLASVAALVVVVVIVKTATRSNRNGEHIAALELQLTKLRDDIAAGSMAHESRHTKNHQRLDLIDARLDGFRDGTTNATADIRQRLEIVENRLDGLTGRTRPDPPPARR